ncbi:hypothetical protein [Sporosarcina sp. FSL K6-5500]|uniref:hypothetical protein n=1 Tax=Sporosarcina sp. FSL K6-5500 TaxID=2921558 RepID=UPI0030FB098A
MGNSVYLDLLNPDLFNIFEGEITFSNEIESSSSIGNISMCNSLYPQIILTLSSPLTIKADDETIFDYYIQTSEDHILNEVASEWGYYEDEKSIVHPTIYLDNIETPSTEVDEVIIFIMNCSHIGLTFLEQCDYNFAHNDWIINLKFRPDKKTESFYDDLRKNRGYEITHVGTISSKYKNRFYSNEITDVVVQLEWYLSFFSAQNVFIPILIGLKDDNKVWEKYRTKNRDIKHFQDSHGCFPYQATEDFNLLFTKVATKLEEEIWSDVLKVVLNWYLEIKSTGMYENKIISTQIALEQLAWNYLVNQEQVLDKEAYKRLRASDILRLFCYQLNIPNVFVENPGPALINKYNNDSVHMFVDFRNNLVHPEKKSDFNNTNVNNIFYAYKQGLYFLERAITIICGYKGKYR